MKKVYILFLFVAHNLFGQISGSGVFDIDGNNYPTVIIGNQEWMQTNLRVTKYKNSDLISTTSYYTQNYSNESEPKYQWLSSEGLEYGRYYTWYVAIDPRGLCPEGWRVPSANDWETLVMNLGGFLSAGGKMKESGLSHWLSPNTDATNESNFTALPAGYHHMYGTNTSVGNNSFFTSTTDYSIDANWFLMLSWISSNVFVNNASPMKHMGLSCRCIKEDEVGLNEHINDIVKIYPNPINQNLLQISTGDSSPKTVVIFNAFGQIVLETSMTSDELELDLQKGLYIIEIKQHGSRYFNKLIVN